MTKFIVFTRRRPFSASACLSACGNSNCKSTELSSLSHTVVFSDSYFYTDTSGFLWDRQLGCWTKDNLGADLSRSRLTPSPPPAHDHSTLTLPSSSSLDGSEYTHKTETSDISSYYSPIPYGRPISQLSYRSDDLQTIPSQDVSACQVFGYSLHAHAYTCFLYCHCVVHIYSHVTLVCHLSY